MKCARWQLPTFRAETAMNLHTQIRDRLRASLDQPASDEAARLNDGLRLLSKWRRCSNGAVAQRRGLVMKPKAGQSRP